MQTVVVDCDMSGTVREMINQTLFPFITFLRERISQVELIMVLAGLLDVTVNRVIENRIYKS